MFLAVLEGDSYFELQQSDFQEDLDSEVLVREQAKGSKLEGFFDRDEAKVIEDTPHTVATLPKKSGKHKTYYCIQNEASLFHQASKTGL